MDAVSLLIIAGLIALGNALVLWQLNNVKTDLVNRIDGVKTDLVNRIDGVKTDLDNRIDGVKTDLDNRIDGVKADLGDRIDGVKTDLGDRIDGVKADLDAHEKECVARRREDAERDRKLHASIGGLIHAIEGKIPHPSA